MSRNDPFQKVGGLRPGRSVFNLSHRKLFDTHPGWLIPICVMEMCPSDTFRINVEMLIRLNPMIVPVIHEINAFVHYFFVPYRIIWDMWEQFITGGENGDDTTSIPTWLPTAGSDGIYSLFDYFGFLGEHEIVGPPAEKLPMILPLRCYNSIWNYYYRDQNISQERELDEDKTVALRAFERDYFSASLPFMQRGVAPALPLTGQINLQQTNPTATGTTAADISASETSPWRAWSATAGGATGWDNYMQSNYVDLEDAATFNVSDLRLSFQIQKFMERNARAGVRYQEFLRSHFGYSATDQRLNYPEYLFGKKIPIVISEVLQTSETNDAVTPQGNLAGHGIASQRGFLGSYTAPEFGCLIGMFSILPRTSYHQGINRMWHRETRYDYYFPEFSHLSEQPVLNAEIFGSRVANGINNEIFGYVGRYDELRTMQDEVMGAMRTTLSYWHLSREFADTPTLNEQFMYCDGSQPEWQRIFAEQTQPNYICHVANKITAIRPMPIEATPGLIDHN